MRSACAGAKTMCCGAWTCSSSLQQRSSLYMHVQVAKVAARARAQHEGALAPVSLSLLGARLISSSCA